MGWFFLSAKFLSWARSYLEILNRWANLVCKDSRWAIAPINTPAKMQFRGQAQLYPQNLSCFLPNWLERNSFWSIFFLIIAGELLCLWSILEEKNTYFGPSPNIRSAFCLEKSQASQRGDVEESHRSKSVVSWMRVCIVVKPIIFIGLEALLGFLCAKHATAGA